MQLTKSECAVVGKLLEMASDEFGNHGCNDFELDHTDENIVLVEKIYKWNDPDEDRQVHLTRDGKIFAFDSELMHYFSDLFKEASEATPAPTFRGPSTSISGETIQKLQELAVGDSDEADVLINKLIEEVHKTRRARKYIINSLQSFVGDGEPFDIEESMKILKDVLRQASDMKSGLHSIKEFLKSSFDDDQ